MCGDSLKPRAARKVACAHIESDVVADTHTNVSTAAEVSGLMLPECDNATTKMILKAERAPRARSIAVAAVGAHKCVCVCECVCLAASLLPLFL